MNQPLRALLLAAGLGTRLRPLTLQTPKCLMQIDGEPLLGRWLRHLEQLGCESVLVNTHYLATEVEAFLRGWNSPIMELHTSYEPNLLGTAGTLIANSEFFSGATGLLIHADNAMASSLTPFLNAHLERQRECLLTMLTFETSTPSSCGIIEIDEKGVVQQFYEKIPNPPGNRANGALYAFDQSLLNYLARISPAPTDFSTQVIPRLLGCIQTYHTDEVFLDIGTPEALKVAQKLLNTQS
jgi:mannose-1-phosphate guanylyltransferase